MIELRREGTITAPRRRVGLLRLALAVTVAAGVGQAQPGCPPVNFQGAASASLKPSASTHTVVLQQRDRSYTAFELTDASPYRIVRTTRNFQRQFAGCPGLPVTGVRPVNQPPEVFTPLSLGGYLWARIIAGAFPLDLHLNVAVFDSNLSLMSETQYPVANVGALAVADVNGDGLPDILLGSIAFHNPNNVTVQALIGTGGSSFQPATSFVIPASVFLYSILVADLNGDHKPDLVISSSLPAITGKISVFLGNGDGTFQGESTAFSGIYPAVAIADLNGDGKPDLAFTLVTPQTSNFAPVAVVALGAGDGTFKAPTQYPSGGTDAIAMADLNGDGFPDIVTSGFSILFGDGTGRFPKRADYWQAVDGGIILADFDGDGKPDLIVGSGNSAAIAGPAIAVLFARGGGSFGSPPISLPNGAPAWLAPMAYGDFDGDGFPDLVGQEIGGQVGVLTGIGDGTFRETFHYATGSGALVTLATGDFNGDGKPDIITALIESPVGHLQVLLGKGDGTFQPPVLTTTPFGPSAIALADFNGDGRLDVAFLAADSSVLIYLGTGAGTFAAPLAFPAGPTPSTVAVGDFNRDGRLDLVVGGYGTSTGSNLIILFGKGDGTFLAPVPIAAIANSGATGMVAADLNRDGLLDVAVTTNDERLLVLLGRGDGTFGSPVTYSAIGFGHPYAADLNGDGTPDLISGNFANWLLGNGDGTFQPEVLYAGGHALGPIVAADFNHDGRLDLAGGATIGVATLLNISQAAPLTIVSAASFAVGPLAADSLATAFGSGLVSNTTVSVGGTSAAILYASAGQVNFLVPASLPAGPASVTITSNAGSASAPVTIAAVAPAVFTVNSAGLAAAYVVRVRQGSQTIESISDPIDLGPPGDQVYLSLFGTGIRGAPAAQVSVRVQGINAPVVYFGPQPQFSGLDQVNVLLPRELTGTGDASVVLTAAGTDAATVHISVK